MKNRVDITVLSDNRKVDETLESEHGLCVFLDTGTHTMLLDTGASGLFLHHAERLGIDVRAIDYVFHIGGLLPFLEINTKATILLSEKALNQRFFSNRNGLRNLGVEAEYEKYKERFVFIEKETRIDGDISIFSCDSTIFSKPNANRTLFKDSGNGLEIDDFNHELVFCYGTEDIFVYTGCGHKGLLNILVTVEEMTGKKPQAVLGGFHLLDSKQDQVFETESEIDQLGDFLSSNYPDTRFITGHCTGSIVFEQLSKQLNQQIELFYTGYTTQF
jgi:7,8-dihydropterin-6-yl-methyl-4-(beta-D-ribofuranosyl)aminobenzene 5'-phosphate synthase